MATAETIKSVLSNPVTLDRVIEMAWEDRTPFEAIEFQFGITEADVIEIMRRSLKRSSFNLWRKRVNRPNLCYPSNAHKLPPQCGQHLLRPCFSITRFSIQFNPT